MKVIGLTGQTGAGKTTASAALRAGGCRHLHEVESATLEVNGQITVVLRKRDSE